MTYFGYPVKSHMSLSSMCQKGGQIMPVTLLLVLSPIFKMQSTPHFTLFKPRGTDYARHTTASPPYSKCNLHLISPYSNQGGRLCPSQYCQPPRIQKAVYNSVYPHNNKKIRNFQSKNVSCDYSSILRSDYSAKLYSPSRNLYKSDT